LAIVAAVVWHAIDVLGTRRLALRRKVLVNLHSGVAFKGVLWARRGRLLVLKGAELLEPNADPVTLDGDTIVDRDQVAWVQAAGLS
jgi:hypothetical protein